MADIHESWAAFTAETVSLDPSATIRPVSTDAVTLVQGEEPLPTLPVASVRFLPRLSIDLGGGDGARRLEAAGSADLKIQRTLGEGGMGRVLLARQVSLDRDVAIKTTKPDAPPVARDALLTEARVTGSLEHPGIVPVHAVGLDEGGRPVLVMKRVEGVEWRELIDDPKAPAWEGLPGRDDPQTAHLEIFMQVCNAVHFAHSRGVVHRDIKPENVMIGRYGEVYLVDWGIAASVGTMSREACGTPGYMAPEMVTGGIIDARTDVYLLGATLHEILTGGMRHAAATLGDLLLEAALSKPFAYGEGVPAELAELCNRATSCTPEGRPATALEVRAAVSDYVRHRGAIHLAHAAEGRLAVLREILSAGGEGGPVTDSSKARQVATECRFGFTQALKEWAECPSARVGLEECVEKMADLELRQGNLEAARDLIAELAAPTPKLKERLAELERAVMERAERDRRLQRIEHDLDVTVAAPQRSLAALAILVFAVAVGIMVRRRGGSLDPAGVAAVGFAIFLVVLSGIIAFRRFIWSNAFNRHVAGLTMAVVTAVLLDRLISLTTNTPMWQTLQRDMLLFATVAGVGGITVSKPFLVFVPLFLIGLVVSVARPSLAADAFSAAAVLSMASIAYIWRRKPPAK